MQNKKPWLIDVPVKVAIWIRPDCQRKQFEVIKEARPSRLFLVSDGGRNDTEWKAILQSRQMYEEEVDWECEITKIYNSENLGLYTTGQKAKPIIWDKIEYGIFLEDDIIPSVSYFRFCAELLEKYKNDERIESIVGMNILGQSPEVPSDYFFSKFVYGWAIATWKRTINDRCHPKEFSDDSYTMRLLKRHTRNDKYLRKTIVGYSKQEKYEGHVAASEFYMGLNIYAQHRLQIIPKVNLIKCVGATANAAHSDDLDTIPRGLRRIYNMETYEIRFPLKHPRFVINDDFFDKKNNRIMGYNAPLVQAYRKVERIILLLMKGRFRYIYTKLKKIGQKVDES